MLPKPIAEQSTVGRPDAAEVTAAELVESVSQLDDSGANTADRYDWQAAMAAANGLALYHNGLGDDGRLRPDCQDRVLCEWQEDWVLFSGDSVVLVSCKHRDPSAGAYTTVVKLVDDGGLAHLFNRWAALHETPLCQLVTSGGLSSGPPQELLAAARYFRALRSAAEPEIVNSEHAEIVAKLRQAITTYCENTRKRWDGNGSSPTVSQQDRDAEVARFLAALTIAEGQIQRHHVGYAAPKMYVQPILEQLRVTGSAEAVWEAVLSLFRARMRSRGPLPTGGLPVVLEGGEDSTAVPAERRRTLAARTVTMRDIETAMTTALTVPGGYEPVPRMPWTSRLEVKMHVGGCSENAIERALSLRVDYQDYWRDRESIEPTARVERKRLERRLHRVSDQSTDSALPQGAALWRRLQAAVDSLEQEELPAGMDTDLALGGVCELAGRCKVWFGPRFNVDTVIARIRGTPGGGDVTDFDGTELALLREDLAYHQARVLLLVTAVSRTKGNAGKLDGLTKLAKLDFLLRYPALAPEVLDRLDIDDPRLHLAAGDVAAPTEVEAPMTRYKYGPWDDRYYAVLGALIGRRLVRYTTARKGSVAVAPTADGRRLAAQLAGSDQWADIADRGVAIAEASAGVAGNALKDLIYQRLAGLMDRPHRQVIR